MRTAATDGTPGRMAHPAYQVVVIEDDGGMRQAIRRIVSSAGFSVHVFASAEEFLLAPPLVGEQADCLVCDVRLPGMSGIELHRRLRARGTPPPCVFITAHDDHLLREQAELAGAAYLLKPFEGRALLALVARMLPMPG